MSPAAGSSSPEGHPLAHAQLRVALLAGTLGQGGAEKQLVYMTRALRQANVAARIYSLTRDEFYEPALRSLDVEPIWIGRHASPLLRLGAFVRSLRAYKPHIVQSGHFFANLYVALAAPLVRAVSIGTIRSDVTYDMEMNPWWAPWSLRLPASIMTNSYAAGNGLKRLAVPEARCHVVPNVIDLVDFDARACEAPPVLPREGPCVIAVGTLSRVKRLDRFLDAVSLARASMPNLRAMIIGDGPERSRLETAARERGLLPDGVQFLGRRPDVPVFLRQAAVLLLTSEHEGCPNVVLEAMAARLPVVTTAVGDAGRVVQDGVTGYVVSCDDVRGMAERVLQFAKSSLLRQRFGDAGRLRVEQTYSYAGLARRLLATYRTIAEQQRNRPALEACLSNGLPAAS